MSALIETPPRPLNGNDWLVAGQDKRQLLRKEVQAMMERDQKGLVYQAMARPDDIGDQEKRKQYAIEIQRSNGQLTGLVEQLGSERASALEADGWRLYVDKAILRYRGPIRLPKVLECEVCALDITIDRGRYHLIYIRPSKGRRWAGMEDGEQGCRFND